MLTGDLVRPRLRRRANLIEIEQVNVNDPYWLNTAEDLIELFNEQAGNTRSEWDTVLEAYEGDRTDYEVVRGLAKVLSDAGTFLPDETPIDPVELREMLFKQGPVFDRTSLFIPHTRDSLMAEVAEKHTLSSPDLEAALYADLPSAYRLIDVGSEWTPDGLLARYNLELARGVLYWAREMQVEIHDTFKDFWKYLKLFKLMFWSEPIEGGYHVTLDGPISPFVRSTTRYGRQMAAFLPALLLCNQWQMQANIRMSQFEDELLYQLDHTSTLPSVFKRSGEFDSKMEISFAQEFHDKFGDERGKWLLNREDEVLLLGDTVFIPDFSVTNKKDGRRALIEILGFWHPDYLKRKLAKIREANRNDLILLVYEGVNLTENRLKDVPGEVLYFVNKPVLKDVIAAVERLAV